MAARSSPDWPEHCPMRRDAFFTSPLVGEVDRSAVALRSGEGVASHTSPLLKVWSGGCRLEPAQTREDFEITFLPSDPLSRYMQASLHVSTSPTRGEVKSAGA